MAFSVFISYSTKDLAVASQIKNLLESTTSKVFLAEYSLAPGSELGQTILAAIRDCDLFLLLWSSNASSSEWVPQEIGVAKAHNKPVVPVLLHKDIELPGFLKGLKYLPFHIDPMQALAWLRQNVFEQAQKKQQREGLAWLGIGAAILWLLGHGNSDDDAES